MSWYKFILLLPISHPWWFWPITIIFILCTIYKSSIIYHVDRADLEWDFMTADNYDVWHSFITWIPIVGLSIEFLVYIIAAISYFISIS